MSDRPQLRGVPDKDTFDRRIEVVRQMCSQPGWAAHGDGEPLSEECVGMAQRLMDDLHARGIPWPYLYPAHEGGVDMEWSTANGLEVSIEIDTTGQVIGDATNVKTHASNDFEVPFPQAVEATIAMLREHGLEYP